MDCCATLTSFSSNIPLDTWYNSKYEDTDRNDHSGRVICLIDLSSALYKLAEGVAKLTVSFVKVVGGVALSIILLPYSLVNYCITRTCCNEITNKTWENIKDLGDKFFKFLTEVLPSNLFRAVGNAVGIFLPEVGRSTRTRDCGALFDKDLIGQKASRIVEPSAGASASIPTPYQRWYTSTYRGDEHDHTHRLISLFDITSQLYRFAQAIGELAWRVLRGFGAMIVAIAMVPVTLVTLCCSKNTVENTKTVTLESHGFVAWWQNRHLVVVDYMNDGFMSAPCDLLIFTYKILPVLLIKVIGNVVGIIVPEVGRTIRTNEFLKLPSTSTNLTTDPIIHSVVHRTVVPDDDAAK